MFLFSVQPVQPTQKSTLKRQKSIRLEQAFYKNDRRCTEIFRAWAGLARFGWSDNFLTAATDLKNVCSSRDRWSVPGSREIPGFTSPYPGSRDSPKVGIFRNPINDRFKRMNLLKVTLIDR